MKGLLISCILAAIYVAVEVSAECQNYNEWCHYMIRYGACNFNNNTREQCPRSCQLCTVNCDRVEPADRVDCGFFGITQRQCYNKGCCWDSSDGDGTIWCHRPKGVVADDAVCKDKRDDCYNFTGRGACHFNDYTRDQCPKSCGLC